MNFLQLCQRTAVECGVASGTAIKVALPSVVGATGSLGRVVGWVADAFSDIAQDHDDWTWLRSSNILGAGVSVQTIAGQTSYPLGTGPGTVDVLPDNFGKWDRETFRCQTTAIGFRDEMFLDDLPYDAWRNGYMLGAMRSVQTRPVVVAVGPDQSLNLGPPPNGNYTVTADFFMLAPVLALDADIPLGLPTNYHMLCVYRAMMKYAGYESAPEVYARGSEENAGMYAQLMAVRAPKMSFGGPLA
jgi:hypothetical protein